MLCSWMRKFLLTVIMQALPVCTVYLVRCLAIASSPDPLHDLCEGPGDKAI